jgi:hypothetical protein
MSVQCVITNASSVDTQDGSTQLIINGGTSPYTVTWSNGQQGTVLSNLSPGDYTATVTDYYGDYQITTTCTIGFNSGYLDKFIECNENLNSDIFVFYDGTSLNIERAKTASESIRSWYQNKFLNGFGGLLYEGVVGSVNNNGENWLWWATYPYLGSLTGGTLSDNTTITSYGLNGETVANSVYNENWCQTGSTTSCIPKNPSFNFGTTTAGGFLSDVYKRINNGFQLNGTYGVNDGRTQGVPFTVTPSMDGNYETVYGDFVGGVKDYMVIIVTDESDGKIGFYHGQINQNGTTPNKSFLYTNPFELYGEGWSNTNLKEPTNRFSYEYESFLKVWKDIKINNGRFNGLLYPFIENNVSEIPFMQHSLAVMEGDTISASTFFNEYNANINNLGYLNLNLSALTHTNVYSAMTATTAYYNLNNEDKKGAGLKNFGWKIDPTVSAYTSTEITKAVEPFFDESSLSDNVIYSTPINNLVNNRIYNFTSIDGCYSYDSRVISTGQTPLNLIVSSSYNDCINCNPSEPNPVIQPKLCLTSNQVQYTFIQSGIDSNNNFVWVNTDYSLTIQYSIVNDRWEVSSWSSVGQGVLIQNSNNTIPTGLWVNLGNPNPTTWNITEGECSGIPLTLTAQPSNEICEGDNNGTVTLLVEGGSPPFVFRIQNVPPYPSYSPSGFFSNLSPGSYVAEASGSTGNVTTSFNILDGDPEINYVATTTYQLVSQNSGTKTWSYSVEFDPPLPSNVIASFDLKLTHQRISRDSGTATFSQSHTILKNGNLNVPYVTLDPVISTTDVCNGTVVQTNEIFIQLASGIQLNTTDTLNGTVTQTVVINAENANCSPEDCQMLGQYTTSLQLQNLRLTNANSCDIISYPNPLTNITVFLQDCSANNS